MWSRGLYLIGVMALHDVDLFVESALEEQADGLIGDVCTINEEVCIL